MIQDHNLNLTEEEYRDLEIPSYSMLAAIEKQGVDVIQGEKVSFNLKFGSLVDCMCFEPHKVDKLYHRGDAVKSPTTTHKKVVDEVLGSISEKVGSKQSKGVGPLKRKTSFVVSDKIVDYKKAIVATARKLGALKSYTDEKVFKTLEASCSDYFKDKITSRGKTLIKPEMWKLARLTADTLMTHKFSGKYFNHKTKGVEIIYQYKFDTKVNGRRVKGMLDCLIVNHNAKVIIPVDLKTGEAPVKDFPMLYTSHRYYIQGALYREAMKSIVNNDFDLTGYDVRPFEFLYISKLNPYKPMVFVVRDNLHDKALNGFTDRYGYEYKGVYELLGEYYECVEDGYCNYTRDEDFNNARIDLDNLIL